MKRRVLAILCVLSILMGMVVMPATAATTTTETEQATTYQVGYAIKNFNPWVASDFDVSTDVGTAVFLENPEETEDKKIYPSLFSQNGNQTDWLSVVTDLYDDNGDGNVDHNDGIFATCTAVTYGEKTVLFITTDTMKAWTKLVNAVREEIVASDWGQELGITADEIMVCSNHTHSGPQLDGNFNYHIDTDVFDTTEKQTALKTDRETYFNWVVDRIVAAAADSVEDQAPATMSKGAVDATVATANCDAKYNDGKGYHMNTIRHYERTVTATRLFGIGGSASASSIYANAESPSEQKLYDALLEHDFEDASKFNPSGFGSLTTYSTSWSTTDEADNTMYLLRFEFDDPAKDPVVFVNWRAHSTMNSGVDQHSLSGDYAVSLRTVLGEKGYRSAFFQGAAGNVVPHPASGVYTVSSTLQKDKMDWLYEATNKASSLTLDETKKTYIYGKMLAEVAQYCMEETDMTDAAVGEIKTYQTSWKAEKQKYSDDLLAAAIALRAEVMSANSWTEAEFESNYKETLKNQSTTYFPYYYKPNGTTTAIINSRLHFNTVYAQAKTVNSGKTVADYTDAVELDAIMLGENVAFITSPNELADYYHNFAAANDIVSHTAADKEAHNDWAKLNETAYGTPFLLGYANQNSGYIANWLDFQANTEDYTTITGLGAEGYMLYSPGTYESMTSSFAAGQGEALIDTYDKMLNILSSDTITYKCQHCQAEVEWKPLFIGEADKDLTTGHYVMVEDLVGSGQAGQQLIGVDGGATTVDVCLDLNGYTYSSESRCAVVYKGSTLNIMNMPGVDADGKPKNKYSGTGGKMIGMTNSNNPGGGAFSVSGGAIVNLYGGTMEFQQRDMSAYNGTYNTGVGAVFSLAGTLNMYGGTIHGSDFGTVTPYNTSGNYIGLGGAIYISNGATLNMSGGSITSGSVPEGGAGPCVYLAGNKSTVKLSGNASIEDIYYRYASDTAVTISGTYTGTTNLTFNDSSDTTFADSITLQQNLDIGNIASGADVSGAILTCTNQKANGTYWQVRTYGTNLVLYGYDDSIQAVIVNGSDETECTSLAEAIGNYTSNGSNYIKLIKAPTDTAVTISKDTYLDLNGCNVSANITADAPLYVMDSMTDDYNVNDGYGYGKLTGTLTGTIEGVPVDSYVATDGYLKVTETDETTDVPGVSFHRVNLQINKMVLRPRDEKQDPEGVYNPDVYYKIVDGFSADSVVAGLVDSYGIAMRADDGDSTTSDKPSDNPLNDTNRSIYTGFKAGKGNNTGAGTLLTDVLKESNNILINRRNANIAVYGSAYIEIDGKYMFGGCQKQTLKSLVQGADLIWDGYTDENGNEHAPLSTQQKEGLMDLYETYESIFSTWSLTNLEKELANGEREALKILVVGNSHGLDATNLLYEVFESRKNSDGKYVAADGTKYNKVVIGALYHSSYSMRDHAAAANNTGAVYSYHEISTGDATGTKWQLDIENYNDTMNYGLQKHEWDIVVMQQMNHRSGSNANTEDSYNFNQTEYKAVASYIMKNCKNGKQPKLAWHMIWTNPDDTQFFDNKDSIYTHPSYRTGSNTAWVDNHNDWYGTDGRYVQSNMYDAIVNALKTKILSNNYFGYNIDYVLPSAVAVQYAQDILGCTDAQMYRDWTHMSDYGRLMVAYTWWAKLMGYDSIGTNIISEIPVALSSYETGKNAYPANTDGKYVITDDLKRIITRSVNYALDMNDPSLDNAYQIEEDNTISILGIGNSYTIDSMWMLGEVYAAENPGKDVKLGIAYKAGESLAGHVKNIDAIASDPENAAVYTYYEWNSSTRTWNTTANMTLQDIIAKKNWEMVSMQQSSTLSGVASTYNSDIQTIQNKVETVLGYKPTYLWNMTWAYPEADIEDNYTLENAPNAYSFESNYGRSQATMYKAIVDAVQAKIVPDSTFKYLMPVGTAVQNANATYTDFDLYRDYTHLNELGTLIAAYTWYCELETTTLDTIKCTSTRDYTDSTTYTDVSSKASVIAEAIKAAMQSNFTTTDDFVD